MEYEIREDCLTIYLDGELDHHALRTIALAVEEKIDLLLPKKLVLDMHAVRFMDSSGIGLIMGRSRLMEEYGGTLEIHNPSQQIRKVLRISGADRLAVIRNHVHQEADREYSLIGVNDKVCCQS